VIHQHQLDARTVEGHRVAPVVATDLRVQHGTVADVSAFNQQRLGALGWKSEPIGTPADTTAAFLWHRSDRAFELTFPSSQPSSGLAFQVSESYVS
jgi:hypothetical protein